MLLHTQLESFKTGCVSGLKRIGSSWWTGRHTAPDLNPIENLWKLLKERICDKYPELSDMPKNTASWELLVRAAIDVWELFEDELLERLVESMDRRMEAVIAAKGWYTKY